MTFHRLQPEQGACAGSDYTQKQASAISAVHVLVVTAPISCCECRKRLKPARITFFQILTTYAFSLHFA